MSLVECLACSVTGAVPRRRGAERRPVRRVGGCGSDSCSGRAGAGSLVGVDDDGAIDADRAGDPVGEGVGQAGLSAFDPADGLIAGPDSGAELLLGQAGEYSEIGEGALGRVDDHQLVQLDLEYLRRPRQQVGLWCSVTGFPAQDRRFVYVGEPAEFAATHPGALARGLQPSGLEAVERAFHAVLANIAAHLTIRVHAVIKYRV